MKKKYATMSPEAIKSAIADGWKVTIYGNDTFISEVSFTKTGNGKDFLMKGYSFMADQFRQRELESLVNRIQKIYPKTKIKS